MMARLTDRLTTNDALTLSTPAKSRLEFETRFRNTIEQQVLWRPIPNQRSPNRDGHET